MFGRNKTYTRSELMESAHKAQKKGKRKKAIVEYRKALKLNPKDHEILGRLAPLLAETKQFEEAWSIFNSAAQGYLKKGFDDKAIGVYTQATRYMPRKIKAWELIAELQVERKREADAVRTLLQAHRNFKRKELQPQAVRLLRIAWKISPWHFDVSYALGGLLAKIHKKDEGVRLLTGLAEREKGRNLKRTRFALLKMSPSGGALWHWVRALVLGK